MIALLRRMFSVVGVDTAVGFVLLGHSWNIAFRFVQLVLILWLWNPVERSFFFSLLTLLNFQALFELGFGSVIQQVASHEAAFLTRDGPLLGGDANAKARLGALLRFALGWFAATGAIIVFALGAGGERFFRSISALDEIPWLPVWGLTVPIAALVTFANGVNLFLTGCGDVIPVARVSLLQSIANSLGFCAAILLGGGLFGVPAGLVCGLTILGFWQLYARGRLLQDLLRTAPSSKALDWRAEVWPFQWRMALSWLSGVLLNQLLNPVVLASYGPDNADRFGLSLALLQSLQLLGFAWISTKIPTMGACIAQRRYEDLDRLFLRSVVQSSAFLISAMLVLVAIDGVCAASTNSPYDRIAERILPPIPFSLMALMMLTSHLSGAMAVYLRAHKREPLLPVSVVSGVCVATWVVSAGQFFDLTTLLGGLLALNAFFGVVVVGWIFWTKRREWH